MFKSRRFIELCLLILICIEFVYPRIGLKNGFETPPGLNGTVRTIVYHGSVYLWGMSDANPSKFQEWVYNGTSWHMNYELNQCPYQNNDFSNVVIDYNNSLWFTGSGEPTNVDENWTSDVLEYHDGNWTNHGFIWANSNPFIFNNNSAEPCGNNEKLWYLQTSPLVYENINILTSCDAINTYSMGQIETDNSQEFYFSTTINYGKGIFLFKKSFQTSTWYGDAIWYTENATDWEKLSIENSTRGVKPGYPYTFLFNDGEKEKFYFTEPLSYRGYNYGVFYWDEGQKKFIEDNPRGWHLNYSTPFRSLNPTYIQFNGKTYLRPARAVEKYYEICNSYDIKGKVNGQNPNTTCVSVHLIGTDVVKNDDAIIDENGNFTFPSVPPGEYHLIPNGYPTYDYCPGHDITVTVENKDVYVEFTQLDLRGLAIEYSPKGDDNSVLVGKNIDFSILSKGIEPQSYQWNFGDGTTSNEPYPTHTYKNIGNYTVSVTLTLCNNVTKNYNKNIIVKCPSTPPSPTVLMHLNNLSYTDDGKDVFTISDQCIVGSEYVEIIADPINEACGSNVFTYKWFLKGVEQTLRHEKTENFTLTNGDRVMVTITDGNGKTASFERTFKLIPCQPSFNESESKIILKNDNDLIIGNKLMAIDDPDNKTINVSGVLAIDCECEFTPPISYSFKVSFLGINGYEELVSWPTVQVNTIQKIIETNNYNFVTTRGWGKYKVELTVDENGKPSHNIQQILVITAPFPEVTCPKYGCGSTPDLCEELYDLLPNSELDPDADFTIGTHSEKIPALGGGAANKQGFGFWDEGHFKHMKLTGDFEIVVRVNPSTLNLPGMEAGIMIRTGLQSFDKMIYLGYKKQNTVFKTIATVRNKIKEDVGVFNVKFGTNEVSHEFLKIKRINGVISLYSASTPSMWMGPIYLNGKDAISGFDGTVYAGVFAAGDNDNWMVGYAEFSPLIITSSDQVLSKPGTIINSKFPQGNLISNWSFENKARSLIQTGSGIICNMRAETFFSMSPYEGRYSCFIQSKPAASTVMTNEYPCYYTNADQQADMLNISFRILSQNASSYKAMLVKKSRADGTYSREALKTQAVAAGVWTEYSTITNLPNPSLYETFAIELLDKDVAASNIVIDNVVVYPCFAGGNTKPVTAMTFADAFDQKFQTITTQENEDLVSALQVDDDGRVRRTLPEFTSSDNLHGVKTDPLAKVKSYYAVPKENHNWVYGSLHPDNGKITYENSPLGRDILKIGRLLPSTQFYTYSTDDYSVGDNIAHRSINSVQTNFNMETFNFQFSTEYKNAYGYPVEKRSGTVDFWGAHLSSLKNTYDPDVLGRVWKAVSPMGQECDPSNPNCIKPSFSTYNTTDKVIESENPDKGKNEFLYDKLDNVRFFRDAQKTVEKKIIVNMYDAFSRLIEVFIVDNSDGSRWKQINADDIGWPKNVIGFGLWAKRVLYIVYDEPPKSEDLPTGLVGTMLENTDGKISAQCAFNTNDGKVVSSYFSYDEYGSLKTIWRDIPGLKLQKQSFVYNLSGQVVKKVSEGIVPTSDPNITKSITKGEVLSYDELGRLQKVNQISNGTAGVPEQIVSYEYLPDGKLAFKNINDKLRIKYVYDAQNRLVKQVTQEYNSTSLKFVDNNIYMQDLVYNDEGNIASQDYFLRGLTNPYRRFLYSYDDYNRLRKSEFGSGSTGIIQMTDPAFDEAIEYNNDGAIVSMSRGSNVGANIKGTYAYQNNSHRLKNINGMITSGGKNRNDADNYVYDANGNVVEDKALRIRTEYDYRNLPVTITSYANSGMTNVLTIIRYIYDADGNRVVKTRDK